MLSIGWPRTAVGRWRLILLGAAAALSAVILFQPPPWEVFTRAAGKMRVADYAVAYTSIAAAVNILLLGVLALICPWWAQAAGPETAPAAASQVATPRWFWPIVLSAVLTCGLLNAPRLTQSLWDDEEASLMHCVLGRYVRQAREGALRLKEVPWRNTFFHYETPNNHVLYNAIARTTNSLWRVINRPEGLQFREWALRLPAFLAGLATLAVVALLLRDIGLPFAGGLAAWLLALHPWFGKYCAEARGYTLAALLLYSALVFWRRGLLTAAWKWWSLFAIAQVLCLWTWPGTVAFLAMLNAGTLAIVAFSSRTATPARTLLSRWFCCNALAAVVLLQVMLPLVPQLRVYLEGAPKIHNGTAWLANAGCYLATGAPWSAAQTRTPGRMEICPVFEAMPLLHIGLLVAVFALFVAGGISIMRAGRPMMTVIVASAGGAAMLQVLSALSEMFVFAWYLIYLLPLFVALIAAGLAWAVVRLWHSPMGKITGPGVCLVLLTAYLTVTQPARSHGLKNPTEPVRESVELTRPGFAHGRNKNDDTVTVGMTDPPLCYDADLIWARSLRDLVLVCTQADQQQRPLWLNLGYTWSIREQQPAIQQLIHHPTLFADHTTLLSEFPHCDRMVCRYQPGGVARLDLAALLTPEDLEHVRSNAKVPPEIYFAK